MKPTTIAAVGIIGLVLGQRAAQACSCLQYVDNPIDAMAESSLVLAGKVVSISRVEDNPAFDGHPMPLVRFRVLREWKGGGLREYSVFGWYVWPNNGKEPTPMFDCVHQLKVGESYVLFAKPLPDGQGHVIASCLPGAVYREAAEITAALDRATHHRKKTTPPNKELKLTKPS